MVLPGYRITADSCLDIDLDARAVTGEQKQWNAGVGVHGQKRVSEGCEAREQAKPVGNHLNSLGRERAQYLSGLWGKEGERFGAPKAVFANLFHEEWNSVELARPLAEKLGLPVISRYNRGNNTEAAEAISRKLHQTGGPIFVAWEHKNIVNLVRAIGCSCPWMENWAGEMWPKTDFDEIFILSMQGGTCISLDLQQEGFDGLQPWKDFLEPLVPCSLVLSLAAMVVWLRLKSNDFPFSASSRDVTPVSSASFLKTSSEPFLKTSGMC